MKNGQEDLIFNLENAVGFATCALNEVRSKDVSKLNDQALSDLISDMNLAMEHLALARGHARARQ